MRPHPRAACFGLKMSITSLPWRLFLLNLQALWIFSLCLFMPLCVVLRSGRQVQVMTRDWVVSRLKGSIEPPQTTSAKVTLTASEMFQRSFIDLLGWMVYSGRFSEIFVTDKFRQKKKIVVTSVDLEYLLMTPTCKKATMIKSSCCSVVPLSFFKANVKM